MTRSTIKILFFMFLLFLGALARPNSTLAQDYLTGVDDDVGLYDFEVDDEWGAEEKQRINDPFEQYNQFMFKVNNKIYRYLLDPLADGYDFLIPRPVQGSINNFIDFSSTPKRFFNNLFQKKFKAAASEFARLLINASIGIGGLFDPADSVFKIKQKSEDFGQTLGYYEVGAGPYIIVPLLGPSNGRDLIGEGIDRAFNPFMWLSIFDVEPEDGFSAISITKRAHKYPSIRDNYKKILDDSIEPYVALQNAYISYRNKRIAQ